MDCKNKKRVSQLREALVRYTGEELADMCEAMRGFLSARERSVFDDFETYDFEDAVETLFADHWEVARAIVYGDVRNVVDRVRLNGYGNLVSVSRAELAEDAVHYVDELAAYAVAYLDDTILDDLLDDDDVAMLDGWRENS